ncbi:MAG: amidohydrolase family protein, partial [Pirellulales bacterium]|nr:amidohydrolase family protein [Pirellulales bacterium]
MPANLILKALTIITMDPAAARAEAVAVDTTTGRIAAVGSLEACQQAAPAAAVRDLGATVLMPGFIDPHSHPLLGGIVTQEPAHWISPYRGYATFADVEALWRKLDAELPPGQPVLCNGLDRLLQGAPELTNRQLDGYFPKRPALIIDNSGHEIYFNSAVIALNGWAEGKPPADPAGARFGRNPDGSSNGRAYETAAIVAAASKLMKAAVPNPLLSAARGYALMARNGVTTTTEHTYESSLLAGYVALAGVPDCPLRLALYHMSIDPTCGEKVKTPIPEELLWKQGIKLWADGSPWVGTIAASFPYLDNETTRRAEIPLGPAG